MNSREYKITEIKVTDLDLSNSRFRISKPLTNERISRIVEMFGSLIVPLVIKGKKGFILLTGHNIIELAVCSGENSIRSIVIDENDPDIYLRETILMNIRGELGPFGRLKSLGILKEYFGIDEARTDEIGRVGYQLPEDFLKRSEFNKKIEQIPPELKEYIERRDISFKIIRNLLKLSGKSVEALSEWVGACNIRVNIFRDLVDMLFDLQRGGKITDELQEPIPHEISDQRQYEKTIYERVYRLRYPEYFRLKKKAEKLAAGLQSEAIEIEYPEYFETGSLKLTVTLRKSVDIGEISTRIENLLKSGRLKDLLKLM